MQDEPTGCLCDNPDPENFACKNCGESMMCGFENESCKNDLIGRCACGFFWCKSHAWSVKNGKAMCAGCAR